MIYILDTANLEDIKHCNEYYPLAGVTTNPTIISKENSDFWTLLKNIRGIIGYDKMLHVQTVQKKANKIVEEAKLLKKELGGNFYIKIPISKEGLKATMEIKRQKLDIGVTITAIFTPAQALIAAKAGADFVAPYVNRLDNILGDGINVVEEIVLQLSKYNMNSQVIAASFKNVEQVHKCATAGCHSVTVTSDVLENIITHPMTDISVEGFEKDWETVYGNKTILDL